MYFVRVGAIKQGKAVRISFSIVADRLDGAGVESFYAEFLFAWRCGLLKYVGIAVFVVTSKILRRSVAADVAVNTLAVDVKSSVNVVTQSVVEKRHR